MGSWKMVLMNLYSGSNGDANMENRLVDMRGGVARRGSDEWREWLETYMLPYVK